MGASSSTGTLSDEVLPEELLMRVLGHVMLRYRGLGLKKCWCGDVRGVSRQWRALHDGACESLYVRDGVTDEVTHALCGRLPAHTSLSLYEVASLTEDGLRAVGGLTSLTILDLCRCNVTDRYMKATESLSGRDTRTKPATQQQQQQHQQHHQQ